MKLNLAHIIIGTMIFGLVISAFVLSGNISHPENDLIGTWKEIAWTYDRVDAPDLKDSSSDEVLEKRLREVISQDLVIHKSETWTFKDGASLELAKNNSSNELLNWRLKGRGHILKLVHSDNQHEFYQIKELSKDKLVLHFENDNHARGIVRIEFEKVND